MAAKGSKIDNSQDIRALFRRANGDLSQPPTKKRFSPQPKNNKLPVYRRRDELIKLLNENQVVIVAGETGCGKTTQIPQWCINLCPTKPKRLGVACTQPRRIAAMSVATRVANEMKVKLGDDVGYSVRFETCASQKTILKYLTDGMLLREAMLDSLLSSYGVIIVDEAHERTLQTEILLGVVKRAMVVRNDKTKDYNPLKVIIMSATLDAQAFMKHMQPAVVKIEGRQHPVVDMFTEVPQPDLLTSTLITVFQIHRNQDEGDILVFCTGQDEIHSLLTLCKKALKHAPESMQNITPMPLYASLPAAFQMKVFDHEKKSTTNGVHVSSEPSFNRRVIFATNVAETSVTIPNIKFVIDTGKVKLRTYCPKTGLESLKVITISKSQAKQRSGRAGRLAPGTCYRLYTSEDYDKMDDHPTPEIKRCNLDSVIMQVISMGISDLNSFDFLERPDRKRLTAALSNLISLRAIKVTQTKSDKSSGDSSTNKIDDGSSNHKKNGTILTEDNLLDYNYELTNIGKKLCLFPLSPAMGRIILAANELGCLDEVLTLISLLYIENLFHIPPYKQNQADQVLDKFKSNEGDAIMLLKVFKAFKRVCALNRAGLKQWCVEHFIHVKNLRLSRLVRKQLSDLCKEHGMKSSSCGTDTTLVRRALTYGLFNNVASMWNGKYRNKNVDEIFIHPSSCLFKSRPEHVLYIDIIETNKCYMRNCTLIDMSWVREMQIFRLDANSSPNTSKPYRC